MRNLVQHSDSADQLLRAEIEFPRIEEFLKGVKNKLRTNPEYGERIKGDVWFIAAPDVFEVSIGLSYTFDDATVCLLSIWVDSDTQPR